MDKIEAYFKLSQNHTEEDFTNIIKELRSGNDLSAHLMADAMKRQKTNSI